ncbi:photosystem II biogenesis protein Psp29 [Aphanothece hegewaldii]|uniref:photosystem II biogenesis protein Psp29 n=1 Tax=Aphanothece hegewaldii TaxID=1521625 RepID=UPI0015E7A13B|nr:photosystem II biogenesis protein Psp29 [Aphanothece hegewaldii]
MDKVRTVSDSKRNFHTYHTRPINSVYRRVVEELLVELHLLSVNADFRYDPIYAVGVITSFERFMQGYRPEQDKPSIFSGICRSVGADPEQYRRDAESLIAAAKGLSLENFLTQSDSNNQIVSTLNAIANSGQFKYSRLFAIGLYTLLVEAEPSITQDKEKRDQVLTKIAEILHLPNEKMQKDLDVYRGNLDKMDQLLTVIEDALEAERKKRQQKEQEKQQA